MATPKLRITEVLPEGDHHVWVTLSDGYTRLLDLRSLSHLPTHQVLRLPQLVRQPVAAPDGQHVVWPNGTVLDLASVRDAPHGPLPVQLDALVLQARRYRPMQMCLKALEPATTYLDVRPLEILLPRLGLRYSEWRSISERYRPVPPDLVHARLSDLTLLLTSLVPDGFLPGLLQQNWNYAVYRCPHRPLLHTADGCVRFGRLDLVELPLLALLLSPGTPIMRPPEAGEPVLHSQRETSQRPSTPDECGGRGACGQRGR